MKADKFMQYCNKILLKNPAVIMPQLKHRFREGMSLNMIIPVLHGLVRQNKFVPEIKEFCDWLVNEVRVLKSYVITFVFQTAAAIGNEDLAILYM